MVLHGEKMGPGIASWRGVAKIRTWLLYRELVLAIFVTCWLVLERFHFFIYQGYSSVERGSIERGRRSRGPGLI